MKLTAAHIPSDHVVDLPAVPAFAMSAATTPVPRSLKSVIRIIDDLNTTFQPPMREKRYSSSISLLLRLKPASLRVLSSMLFGLIAPPTSSLPPSAALLNANLKAIAIYQCVTVTELMQAW